MYNIKEKSKMEICFVKYDSAACVALNVECVMQKSLP